MSNLYEDLLRHGFAAGRTRLKTLVDALEHIDFSCLEDFAGAKDFDKLGGLAALPDEDIGFISNVARIETGRYKENCSGRVAARIEDVLPVDVKLKNIVKNVKAVTIPVEGLGPRMALKRLSESVHGPVATQQWVSEARMNALLGSCPRTHSSFISGVRCWVAFASKVLGRQGSEFPPMQTEVLAWSNLFRCSGTFSNYVGHLRLAC